MSDERKPDEDEDIERKPPKPGTEDTGGGHGGPPKPPGQP